MTYQVTNVTKPLNSVSKICDQENIVVFSKNGGCIVNTWSGQETPFSRENGVYMLHTWAPSPGSDCSQSDFARQDM